MTGRAGSRASFSLSVLPNEESNLAPQNQNLMYYRYTIRHRYCFLRPIGDLSTEKRAKLVHFFDIPKYFCKKMQFIAVLLLLSSNFSCLFGTKYTFR